MWYGRCTKANKPGRQSRKHNNVTLMTKADYNKGGTGRLWGNDEWSKKEAIVQRVDNCTGPQWLGLDSIWWLGNCGRPGTVKKCFPLWTLTTYNHQLSQDNWILHTIITTTFVSLQRHESNQPSIATALLQHCLLCQFCVASHHRQ